MKIHEFWRMNTRRSHTLPPPPPPQNPSISAARNATKKDGRGIGSKNARPPRRCRFEIQGLGEYVTPSTPLRSKSGAQHAKRKDQEGKPKTGPGDEPELRRIEATLQEKGMEPEEGPVIPRRKNHVVTEQGEEILVCENPKKRHPDLGRIVSVGKVRLRPPEDLRRRSS